MTPRELELLGILQEDCAEIIHIISKIRRFGPESNNNGKLEVTNLTHLFKELIDFAITIEKLEPFLRAGTNEEEELLLEDYAKRKAAIFEAMMVNKE